MALAELLHLPFQLPRTVYTNHFKIKITNEQTLPGILTHICRKLRGSKYEFSNRLLLFSFHDQCIQTISMYREQMKATRLVQTWLRCRTASAFRPTIYAFGLARTASIATFRCPSHRTCAFTRARDGVSLKSGNS